MDDATEYASFFCYGEAIKYRTHSIIPSTGARFYLRTTVPRSGRAVLSLLKTAWTTLPEDNQEQSTALPRKEGKETYGAASAIAAIEHAMQTYPLASR